MRSRCHPCSSSAKSQKCRPTPPRRTKAHRISTRTSQLALRITSALHMSHTTAGSLHATPLAARFPTVVRQNAVHTQAHEAHGVPTANTLNRVAAAPHGIRAPSRGHGPHCWREQWPSTRMRQRQSKPHQETESTAESILPPKKICLQKEMKLRFQFQLLMKPLRYTYKREVSRA